MLEYIYLKDNISEIINLKTETKNIDFKEDLNWNIARSEEKIKLIKDLLAMANTQDGGTIFFGVKDDDYSFIGLSEESFKSLDQTKINDLLQEYSEPIITCQVFKNQYDGKYLAKIEVSEFQEVPIICKKDFHTSNKQILKEGAIYIRTDKATSEAISSAQDMRDLLRRATIKNGDKLISDIESLIRGKSSKSLTEEVKKNYEKEEKESLIFLKENIGNDIKKYGCWEVVSYPSEYNANRISETLKIKELVEKSEVNLLGWNFPHTDLKSNASNFLNGRQSYTIWNEFIEGYRAYRSGFFLWQRALVEDTKGFNINGQSVLDFIRTIRYLTEFFLFFKRYYAELPINNLQIKISIYNIKDRQIATLNPVLDIRENYYISRVPEVTIEEDIVAIDLKIKFKEIAGKIIKKIFSVFNADDIPDSVINDWQDKILNKKL